MAGSFEICWLKNIENILDIYFESMSRLFSITKNPATEKADQWSSRYTMETAPDSRWRPKPMNCW
jgi:hypothetical protein